MHISEANEFISAVLANDEIEFDEDGICNLESDSGIEMTFVLAPPELQVYCTPFSPEEYFDMEHKAALLESLLAINYESDIGGRQEFKLAFHQQLRVPLVTAALETDGLQVDAMRAICDELYAVAQVIRRTVTGDDLDADDEETIESEESEEPSLSAFDGASLRL